LISTPVGSGDTVLTGVFVISVEVGHFLLSGSSITELIIITIE
jgi:hypothetical protein